MSSEIKTTPIIAALQNAVRVLDKEFPLPSAQKLRETKGRVCLNKDTCIKYTPKKSGARRRLARKIQKLEEEVLALARSVRTEETPEGLQTTKKKKGGARRRRRRSSY